MVMSEVIMPNRFRDNSSGKKRKSFAEKFKSKRQKIVTIDGYEFETILPVKFAVIGADFEFGIRIRNYTSAPQRFLLWYLLPILWRQQGREWELQACRCIGRNSACFPENYDCHLVQPKDSLNFLVRGQFGLWEEQFYFAYRAPDGNCYRWSKPLDPGEYQIQCRYSCFETGPRHRCQEAIGEVWLGEVVTPPVSFSLGR
jgi:hypothetical protein